MTFRKSFSVGELADLVTGSNEQAVRQLLKYAGADIDPLAHDVTETVSREAVIDLLADRCGDRVVSKLTGLLRERPEPPLDLDEERARA